MSAVLHQGLFTVIALVAIAELSLTAFLISKGLDTDMAQSHKFHDLYDIGLRIILILADWLTRGLRLIFTTGKCLAGKRARKGEG